MSGKQFEDAARVWDERFATADFVFGTEPNAYLARQAHRDLKGIFKGI